MITIDLPDPPLFRVELTPDSRQVRSGEASVQPPSSSIELGQPTVVRLTSKTAQDDKELASYIAAEKGKFQYNYVRLVCSFYPSEGEQFDKAWLEVELASDSPKSAIAWSMNPNNVHESVKRTSTAKVGAALKFLSSEMSESAQVDEKLYSIRGYREATAKPFWEMKRTDLATLDGLFHFHLVVRSPYQEETRGTVKFSTTIGTRRFLVFYDQRPKDVPVEEFYLGAIK
ncbi:MAG TPA: hypothetical protein VF528_16395 [Pyrinomonadaceae bacterium]|jgi:hypothetical protein